MPDPRTVHRLEQIAQQLVGRIHDDDPEDVGRWLAAMCPDPHDWWALVFVLGAAVPTDRTWKQLTAWCQSPEARRREALARDWRDIAPKTKEAA